MMKFSSCCQLSSSHPSSKGKGICAKNVMGGHFLGMTLSDCSWLDVGEAGGEGGVGTSISILVFASEEVEEETIDD